MTRDEGVKRIKKLLGARCMITDNGRKTSPEGRVEYKARLKAAQAVVVEAEAKMKQRREEILKDTRYCALVDEWKEARKALGEVNVVGGGYRLMAGKDSGFACEVRAEADNWEELVRAVK